MTLQFISKEGSGRFNCLVYGQAGIGKTSLLRTIPPDQPVCTLSAESGLLSVKDMVDSGRVTGVVVTSFDDFIECWRCLADDQGWRDAYGGGWVFIDSLSEISYLLVKKLFDKNPNKSDTLQVWGEYNNQMIAVIKAFRDLTDYNVVFTALEAVEADEVKRRYLTPDIAGKRAKERLPGLFDEVFRMAMVPDGNGAENRWLITSPRDNCPAKDRSGRLAALENPNLAEIQAKIQGA
jgi:hypothetical protein